MPTIAELRTAYPDRFITDSILESPHFHLGVIQAHLPVLPAHVALSVEVLADAIRKENT